MLTMSITALRTRTPAEVQTAVASFRTRYVEDWESWLRAPAGRRPELFGQILRRWQATRPYPMRRLRADAHHEAPYLEDLLDRAREPLSALGDLSLMSVSRRTQDQQEALEELWETFSQLQVEGTTSCVGITKAILLLTDGRIGPAFDSQVRARLGVDRPSTSHLWLARLGQIAEDIRAFETRNGPLATAVPVRFRALAYGRLYDMALGPSERSAGI
jgi:hypothetical protein